MTKSHMSPLESIYRTLVEKVELELGYVFRDKRLLLQALTHPSFANENPDFLDNERLEFLGDSVLGMIVTQKLVDLLPEATEGKLSKRRAGLVNGGTLGNLARGLGLDSYVLFGNGAKKLHGSPKGALGDALEAILGAIYLDGGLSSAESFVQATFKHLLKLTATQDHAAYDPKTELQELTQSVFRVLPSYRLVSKEGSPHDPSITVEVVVDDRIFTSGVGRSRKEAEKLAATRMLAYLREAQDGYPPA